MKRARFSEISKEYAQCAALAPSAAGVLHALRLAGIPGIRSGALCSACAGSELSSPTFGTTSNSDVSAEARPKPYWVLKSALQCPQVMWKSLMRSSRHGRRQTRITRRSRDSLSRQDLAPSLCHFGRFRVHQSSIDKLNQATGLVVSIDTVVVRARLKVVRRCSEGLVVRLSRLECLAVPSTLSTN